MIDLEIMAFSDGAMVSCLGTTVMQVHPDAVHVAMRQTGETPGNCIHSVSEAIEQFKKLTYNYNGELHSPNFLRLRWDGNELCGLLADLKLDYQLSSWTINSLIRQVSRSDAG